MRRFWRPDSTPLPGKVRREDVIAAYRVLLGREPESEQAIATAIRHDSIEALLRAFWGSPEFRSRCASAMRLMDEHAPPIEVEWEVSDTTLATLLGRVAETWVRLGVERPYWSVLAGPQYLPENVAGLEEGFYESGRNGLQMLLATLSRVGCEPAQLPGVFEFGCGLGRVTIHLGRTFNRVTACDISSSHLALARKALSEHRIENVQLVQATAVDFGISEPYDLWFSFIVLQHNPPPVIAAIIKRALSMLRPQGLAIFQVPIYCAGYQFKAQKYLRNLPTHGLFEMHALPQSAILSIARDRNCTLLEIREDGSAGEPWISQVFTFQKA
jgi:SAM-dependent methyltransferase